MCDKQTFGILKT